MEKSLAHIALFTAFIAALGLVPKITLAYAPITAQSMGIMLCGTVLGAKRGALSVLLLLLLVAIGLPLLAGGRGGLGIFFGPTAGFLVGWVIGAFVTGLIMTRWSGESIRMGAFIAAAVGGIIAVYIPGIIGLAITLDLTLYQAFMSSLIFIPGDLLKALIVAFLTGAIAQARPQSLFSRH